MAKILAVLVWWAPLAVIFFVAALLARRSAQASRYQRERGRSWAARLHLPGTQ